MLRSYNFDPRDAEDHDWHALFTNRRRDALFAFTLSESQGSVLLGRDHLGAIPLFYRVRNGVVESSVILAELVHGDETVDEGGITTFIALGTTKLISPFTEIRTVDPGTVIRVHPKGEAEVLYRYRFTPRLASFWSSEANTNTLDHLLRQAARRALRDADTVGLYLSGGIDSGLSGYYLASEGATVHAYTTTPWGTASTEGRFAQKSAETIGATHTLVPFETKRYAAYAESAVRLFANPVGAASALAIACIGETTDVLEEQHAVFAQNADTATASVADQSLLFFAHLLPRPIRRLLHRLLTHARATDNLVALRTTGLLSTSTVLSHTERGYTTLQKLTLAGMLVAHSPVDGDIVIQPSIRAGQRIANLFYDVDVVEFLMSIPLWQRLSISKESKLKLCIRKNTVRQLALRVLPRDIVMRKKGLSVPIHTDEHARAFFDALPKQIGARTLSLPQHRFAAHILQTWAHALPTPPASLLALFRT